MYDDDHDDGPELTQDDINRIVDARVIWLQKLRQEMSDEQFVRLFANIWVQSLEAEKRIAEYELLVKDHEFALGIFAGKARGMARDSKEILETMVSWTKNETANALLKGLELSRKSQGKKGAKAKLASDPKQVAKQYVKSCWQVWQEEPERYKGKAKFAKEMRKLEQCKSLESQAVIEGWCREWEKEASPS